MSDPKTNPIPELRKSILAIRKNLSESECATLSEAAVARLLGYLESKKALKLGTLAAIYRVHPSNPTRELDPKHLVELPEAHGVDFAYPRILSPLEGLMDFSLASHPSDWVNGAFGFQEPKSDLPAVDLKSIAWVLVPGVAFGRKGERIGRGGGFYDRMLPRMPSALRIGFCYEFQLQESLPQSSWDEEMDVIVTESQVIEVNPLKNG